VQVASGIAAACAAPDGTPGVLTAQALDHGTGHLMAAAALRALAARERGEPVRSARLSLARTAAELLAAPRRDGPARPPDPERFRVAFGDVELIAPPGALGGVPLAWAHGPRPLGADDPAW
jgi:crotonobetainyl-CoA:carnitine CoA-transferase CaiB-like acyl-CoA transferase